jgi:hypothetical protein
MVIRLTFWLHEMNESMIALLDLLADLIASDISRGVKTNGDGAREAATPFSRPEASTAVSRAVGKTGPIPKVPADSQEDCHSIPAPIQGARRSQKEDS